MSRLPTFQEMRQEAEVMMADALDVLRSDWADGHGPTAQQAPHFRDAQRLIAEAHAALQRANRR